MLFCRRLACAKQRVLKKSVRPQPLGFVLSAAHAAPAPASLCPVRGEDLAVFPEFHNLAQPPLVGGCYHHNYHVERTHNRTHEQPGGKQQAERRASPGAGRATCRRARYDCADLDMAEGRAPGPHPIPSTYDYARIILM